MAYIDRRNNLMWRLFLVRLLTVRDNSLESLCIRKVRERLLMYPCLFLV